MFCCFSVLDLHYLPICHPKLQDERSDRRLAQHPERLELLLLGDYPFGSHWHRILIGLIQVILVCVRNLVIGKSNCLPLLLDSSTSESSSASSAAMVSEYVGYLEKGWF